MKKGKYEYSEMLGCWVDVDLYPCKSIFRGRANQHTYAEVGITSWIKAALRRLPAIMLSEVSVGTATVSEIELEMPDGICAQIRQQIRQQGTPFKDTDGWGYDDILYSLEPMPYGLWQRLYDNLAAEAADPEMSLPWGALPFIVLAAPVERTHLEENK